VLFVFNKILVTDGKRITRGGKEGAVPQASNH